MEAVAGRHTRGKRCFGSCWGSALFIKLMPKQPKNTESPAKTSLSYVKYTLPVVQQALSLDMNEREIGIIIGFLGDKPLKQLRKIEKSCKSCEEAIRLALKLASANLVSKLYEIAAGSKYEVSAVKLLVHNQLPELFSDKQRVEVDRKSLEVKAEKPADLSDFAAALTEMSKKRKAIEVAEVEEAE